MIWNKMCIKKHYYQYDRMKWMRHTTVHVLTLKHTTFILIRWWMISQIIKRAWNSSNINMQKATTFTHKKHKEIKRNECKKRQNTKQNRRKCKAASEWGALYDCQPVRKGTPGEVPDKANNKSHLNSSFLKTCSFLSSSNSIPNILSSGAR